MALSQADHIEAAKQMLINKRHAAEAEIREIDEALAGLEVTARIISGKPGASFKSAVEVEKSGTRKLANRNVTKLVREYIADYPRDTVFHIPEIIVWLKRQGVTGKDRSLYSAVHVILKKEVKARGGSGGGGLKYKAGVGFFKSREKVDDLTPRDTELPASR